MSISISRPLSTAVSRTLPSLSAGMPGAGGLPGSLRLMSSKGSLSDKTLDDLGRHTPRRGADASAARASLASYLGSGPDRAGPSDLLA